MTNLRLVLSPGAENPGIRKGFSGLSLYSVVTIVEVVVRKISLVATGLVFSGLALACVQNILRGAVVEVTEAAVLEATREGLNNSATFGENRSSVQG